MRKIIPYGHQFIDQNDIRQVVRVLHSDWLTQGPKVKEFEDALCKYTGAGYAVAVSSGTAALHLACLAAGIRKNDEVVTSPISFVASANCVLYCGAKPVFADIQEDTANIDPQEIKRKINQRTKAIIPVHFAGHPADMEEISSLANANNLIVIEDACHALGAEYKGAKIGACQNSDMAVFSFHPVKSITTAEGGAVLTNKKDIYEKLLMLRNHGITKDKNKMKKYDGPWYYEMQCLGFNYRITDIQSALGLSQLGKIDSFKEKRRKIVEIYNQALASAKEITLPFEKSCVKSAWHLYAVRLKNKKIRNRVFNALRSKNIGVQVHYIPIYRQPYYQNIFRYRLSDYKNAEDYYAQALTLPLFPGLAALDIRYVIKNLKRAIQ